MFLCGDRSLVESGPSAPPPLAKAPTARLATIPTFSTCQICELRSILCVEVSPQAAHTPQDDAPTEQPPSSSPPGSPDSIREATLCAEQDAIQSILTSGSGALSTSGHTRTPLATAARPPVFPRPIRAPLSSTLPRKSSTAVAIPVGAAAAAASEGDAETWVRRGKDKEEQVVKEYADALRLEPLNDCLSVQRKDGGSNSNRKRRRRRDRRNQSQLLSSPSMKHTEIAALSEQLDGVDKRRAMRKAALARDPEESWELEKELRARIRTLEHNAAEAEHDIQERRTHVRELMDHINDDEKTIGTLRSVIKKQDAQIGAMHTQIQRQQMRSDHSAAAAFDVMEAMWVTLHDTLSVEAMDKILRAYCNKYVVEALNLNMAGAYRAVVGHDRPRITRPPVCPAVCEMACAFHYSKHLGTPTLPSAKFADACLYVAALDKAHVAKTYPIS